MLNVQTSADPQASKRDYKQTKTEKLTFRYMGFRVEGEATTPSKQLGPHHRTEHFGLRLESWAKRQRMLAPGHICRDAADSSRLLAAVPVIGTTLQLRDREVVIPQPHNLVKRSEMCSSQSVLRRAQKFGNEVHRHAAASAQKMRKGAL